MGMGTNRPSLSQGNQEMLEPKENGAHLDTQDPQEHRDREDHGVPKAAGVSRVLQDLLVSQARQDPREPRCTSRYLAKRDLSFDQSL